jgi:hypothetical protein
MQSTGPASALFIAGWATSRADGTFTFENLAAGEYTLYLDGTDGANAGAVTASRQVTVAGKDIDNLIVTALPTLTVTGRVRFEPAGQATPGPAAQKAISVRPESSADSPLSMGVKTTVGADWTFGIRNLSAGPTRFTVAGLPSGWAVEAITFDGRDVTEVPLDVRSDLNGVEIVLTSQLTELTGLVTDGDARPVAECVLIVYPDDPSRWDRSRRLATARPDQSGRFSVRGLPPGDYLVVAVEHVEGDDAHDPDYLERLRRGATKVTLGKGETKSLDLKVVDGTAGS